MRTVPAYNFFDPTRRKSIAAARSMPGVWAVLVSSRSLPMTRTPSVRQSGICTMLTRGVLAAERVSDRDDQRLRTEADARGSDHPVGIGGEIGLDLGDSIGPVQMPAVGDPVGQSDHRGGAHRRGERGPRRTPARRIAR